MPSLSGALIGFRRWWRVDASLSAVRLGIAVILFATAVLKTQPLASEPIIASGLFGLPPAVGCGRAILAVVGFLAGFGPDGGSVMVGGAGDVCRVCGAGGGKSTFLSLVRKRSYPHVPLPVTKEKRDDPMYSYPVYVHRGVGFAAERRCCGVSAGGAQNLA